MIPRFSESLNHLAMKMALEFTADAATSYAAANLGMTAVLLQAASQEAERHIDSMMQDISELKTLFASLDNPPFDDLLKFVNTNVASYTNTDVTALHAQGLTALTQLHEWSETHLPALEKQIWAFLENHVERHQFELPL